MKRSRLLLFLSLLVSTGAAADYESRLRDAGSLGGIRLAGTEDPNISKVYIVQLQTPSAADYHASMTEEQNKVLARAGSGAELIYRYQYGLNGFAARMHPSQAHKLESLPDVLHVWEDEVRPLATTHSLDFLGLFDEGVGLRGTPGLDGEGVVIGVIDSGIYPKHPALRDTREADRPQLCQGSWAENSLLGKWLCHRFEKLEDVLMFEPPENWSGTGNALQQQTDWCTLFRQRCPEHRPH
jgi:subtilisin family serine protease